MSRHAFAVVALLLASGVAAHTTQDVRSQQAGASGMPQVVSSVAPLYPPIARSARVAGDVMLAITVGTDGRPMDVRVTRSIPLLDVAAIQAARQWIFSAPPPGAAPIVPVTFHFDLRSFALATGGVRGPGVAQDFALQYSYTCAAGMVEVDTSRPIISELLRGQRGLESMTRTLVMAPEEDARLYMALINGGFFELATAYPGLASVLPAPAVIVSDRGLEMTIDGGPPPIANVTTSPAANPPRYSHLLRVRRNGSLHVLQWDEPAAAGASQSSAIGAAVRDVITRANGGATPEPGRNVCR